MDKIKQDNIKEEIAKNLLFYRKKAKFTQCELAKKIGVKNTAISSWENGYNSIDIEVLYRISLVLNVSITKMFGQYAQPDIHAHSKEHDELIHKFESIDTRGKEMVMTVLDNEYRRAVHDAENLSGNAG